MIGKSMRSVASVLLAGALIAGCSGGSSDTADTQPDARDAAGDPDGTVTTEPSGGAPDGGPSTEPGGTIDLGLGAGSVHADVVATLAGLLPSDARGLVAVDVDAVTSAGPDGLALLAGDGGGTLFADMFGLVDATAGPVDVAAMTSAVVAQTTDAADGFVLMAQLHSDDLGGALDGPVPQPDGTYASTPLYRDQADRRLALLPEGILIAGAPSVVESVLDIAAGASDAGDAPIAPFLGALSGDAHLSFVHTLPALFDEVAAGRSLRNAAAVSAAIDLADGELAGEMAFHLPDAEAFVAAFNALNLPSTAGDEALDQPLSLAPPIAGGFGQAVVTLPPSPLDPTHDEARAARNLFKKLFAGMDAFDYADAVADRSEPAWLDFVVQSEADGDVPPSPGSVYIRWEFRDDDAIAAFEQNELPAGFRLAPTSFLESDDPDGEYFFALNIYNAAGGSIVTGARAEWDVFVHGPDGADPNAGVRPRFQVVDVLAEEVSADSRDLLTTAQPLSHTLVDGLVVSDIRRFEGDGEVSVFSSSFPVPDPATSEVARFTREMAIGNDYIYWAHGVSDRVLYNATTFNHDAYFVDTSQLEVTDNSRWAEYLKPTPKDAVYYVNSLEYVASPMANLESAYLDLTPEWLAELVAFTTNGHQSGLMRAAVEQFFRGEADPFVGVHVPNDTPSTYYHFVITDPDGFEASLDLPPGHTLAPTTLFVDDEPAHYLTLSVYETADAAEGTRAEWSVYVDNGSGRPPHLTIIDLMTEEAALDSSAIVNLPSEVGHTVSDGLVSTQLSSPTIAFDATFDTAMVTDHELSLDWIEAGDIVCDLHDICDLAYYDAETLDVPVHQPAEVSLAEFSTPWDAFLEATPAIVFYRDNAQEYAVKHWYNLDVAVDELPFTGLDERTHSISGSGTLVGRSDDVADSDYTYSGDLLLDGDQVTFAIDQEVVNQLGIGNIFTTGSFDLVTGTGTQTVVDCQGSPLLCSDIENGSTAFYTAQELDASDPDALSWRVDVVVDLGPFGIADSASTFVATSDG